MLEAIKQFYGTDKIQSSAAIEELLHN